MQPQQTDPSGSALQYAAPGNVPMPSAPAFQSGSVGPSVAEDSDLIETQWVNEVKATLARYQHDPYSLSEAMTKLREDYLMKRYGKHIGAAD